MPEYIDVTELKKQISDFKRTIQSPNGDYLTGYISALSVTEGIIAKTPTADVVEVVRCANCIHLKTNIDKENYCDIHSTTWAKFYVRFSDFCSYGRRKGDDNV